MNEERRARWTRAIRRSRRGQPVSPKEHHALLCEGLFKGPGRADAEEEARYVVRYLLSGEDLSDIPPRGPREACNGFSMREECGAARQTEKLRNMIAASRHDLDYWTALNEIAIRIQEERRWWPAMLADRDIAVRRSAPRPGGPRTCRLQGVVGRSLTGAEPISRRGRKAPRRTGAARSRAEARRRAGREHREDGQATVQGGRCTLYRTTARKTDSPDVPGFDDHRDGDPSTDRASQGPLSPVSQVRGSDALLLPSRDDSGARRERSLAAPGKGARRGPGAPRVPVRRPFRPPPDCRFAPPGSLIDSLPTGPTFRKLTRFRALAKRTGAPGIR